MINYALVCDSGHRFDGWFRNSADFEAQVQRGLVACPICESTKVSKGLMSPNVSTSRTRSKAEAEAQAARETATAVPSQEASASASPATGAAAVPATAGAAPQPNMALNSEKMRELVDAIRSFRKQVTENAENVGDRFAEEARKMHYGEAEERGIYGQASVDDARELLEEGIDVLPLPVLPEDRN
ncbi:DUF1178 family protein [Pseudovibrio exalbescens]|uniref:DUF1178 family protein n=1 Tax=Pseudovibrio exalbescens TaxID=197461 RepID=A0A1U7JJB3_9HYPH|nr:DUF1178 family protein [Pseudovibrio exalbescens]OKL44807.1 hypothetical protein A3843_05755 [Pseudovibrio exalbescens]